MTIHETTTWRLLGAALLAFAARSWLAAREDAWERVRTLAVMEVVWSALGAAVITWGSWRKGCRRWSG